MTVDVAGAARLIGIRVGLGKAGQTDGAAYADDAKPSLRQRGSNGATVMAPVCVAEQANRDPHRRVARPMPASRAPSDSTATAMEIRLARVGRVKTLQIGRA